MELMKVMTYQSRKQTNWKIHIRYQKLDTTLCHNTIIRYKMNIVVTRMFSHEGSRRGKRFIFFGHQIVQNEKGNGDGYIRHGNLDSTRTYNHIDD